MCVWGGGEGEGDSTLCTYLCDIHVCARVRMCACVRACVRVCVGGGGGVRVRARVCVFLLTQVCVSADIMHRGKTKDWESPNRNAKVI